MSSKLNQTRAADSREASRVNLRSVQTQRSTQPNGAWLSSACLGKAATAADFESWFGSIPQPLSCVPWLHGRYPFRRYYGRSDSRRAALRACWNLASFGSELRLPPVGLPDYGTGPSGHSGSNQQRDDRGLPGCLAIRCFTARLLTGFAFHSQARPSTPPESSSQRLPTRAACVTDWSFSFRGSPPRLAATQLRFDTARFLTARERTFHRSGTAPSQAHERTRPACSFRRPAENLVPLTFSCGEES